VLTVDQVKKKSIKINANSEQRTTTPRVALTNFEHLFPSQFGRYSLNQNPNQKQRQNESGNETENPNPNPYENQPRVTIENVPEICDTHAIRDISSNVSIKCRVRRGK